MPDQGPEPTPWELMRGLKRVEDAVGAIGGKVVSVELYAADKARTDSRLRDIEQGLKEAAQASRAEENRSEDQKARNRWLLIGLIASPFVSAIAIFIIQGGLQP
ncbi:hypothetical protein [Glaciibacter superstes]|uniref:hypothetical protein n=1 Tax=Glaciibacter superstes TaxID=501023 RepID=UPI0003B59858|nr:hypothetical protein [Glaciibacter superstes]